MHRNETHFERKLAAIGVLTEKGGAAQSIGTDEVKDHGG